VRDRQSTASTDQWITVKSGSADVQICGCRSMFRARVRNIVKIRVKIELVLGIGLGDDL